jgi:hypothetical protein
MDQIIDAFFQLLQQLILPNWSDLILLVPWVLVAIVLIWLVFSALQWRKAGSRNRARVPRPLAGGAPPPGVHLPGPSRWPFVVPIGAALLLFGFALTPKDAAGNVLAPVNVPIFVVGLIVTLIAVAGWLLDAMREWRRTAVPETDAHVSSAVALAPETASPARRLTWGAPVAAAEPAEPVYVEPPPGVHMPGPSPWPFFAPIGAAVMLYGFIFSSVLIVGGLILSLIAITGWILEAGHEYRSTEAVGHAVPATRDPSRAWPRRLVPIYGAVIVLSLLGTLAPIGISALNSLTPAEATPGPVAVPAQP